MCPCPALFLFVCFLINTAVKSPPGRSLSEVSERESRKGEGLLVGPGHWQHKEQHWGCAKAQRGLHRKWEGAQENLQAVSSAQSKK